MKQAIINTITNYWTRFLEDTSTSQFDNGDTGQNAMMMKMIANIGKPKNYPNSDILLFKQRMKTNLNDEQPRRISVDYSPDSFLGEIAENTLTKWNNMSTFPCKTSMSIDWNSGEIIVREGYGKPFRKLHLESK